ncbi:MAG: CHAT domain-containing protein [Planctomycetes bacterium]|nr:CHAT domain-containing protein [Planctomycetota bacterium]
MQHAERFLVPIALLGAALIGLGLLRREKPVQAAAPATELVGSADLERELEGLRTELGLFRGGEELRLPALRTCARELCERWKRCDVLDVVEYYAGLDHAARLAGLEDEQRYLALRERASRASSDQLDEQEWQAERADLLDGLEELAASIGEGGDRVPAAQATALAARLRVEHLRRADGLGDEERRAELGRLDADLGLAQKIFARAGMLRPRIELDWIRGLRAREQERPEEAEELLGRCLDEARALGEREWQERALEELHGIAQDAGDLPRMEALIGELAALQTPGLTWPVARRYAQLLVWSDQPERAADFLRAHEPAAGGVEADEYALLAGHCLLRTGSVDEALASYARIGPDSQHAREARLSEARALLVRGSAADALARVESATPLRGSGPELRNAWLTLHAEILLALGRRAQSIRELREALGGAANAQRRLFEERGADQTTNVFGEVLGLHAVELLARAELEEGDALGAACTIESAQASTLRLVRGTGQRAEIARGDLVDWARHFELGLATWVVGADETLIVLVAPDGSARGARIAHGRRALEEAVRRLREAVLSGDEPRRKRLCNELGAVLLPAELRDALQVRAGTQPRRLCCLLHGPLEALPIEAFEDGPWIGETVVTAVLPGLPAQAHAPEWTPQDAHRWQLLGDPLGSEGERLLPGAGEELAQIARLHPECKLASGADFDRKHLAAAFESGECLHIATHVRHGAARELRSDGARFALSGGDEFGLGELSGLVAHPALVVLTGCETGGGRFADAEGLQGLARAFLECGTRNLVATNWPVEDRWARAFAIALHRSLGVGLPPSRACAEARRSLRAQGAPASEWAAFRMLGQD